ncbi:TPA: cystatin-like fold lipoprotein [Staphylococcus aureus]|uniref:cystatin-like fold lipoprotein n=1 Tax=Staphylococcus aureus TaxID=1280 RepID=UPI000AAFDCED|nr:cystatin-like fold lipoprotein [Staphylococcus aureus]QJR33046.1 cystatin-like fold lipoprotein [Staphylococcus aureus]WRN81119.1 cystatin-like fold lipoprotein [Staphylococcus aureus]CAC7196777.1 lipoprotein [Staphylococcus aureus]HCW9461840.1 cystatin-like fold lipoprotein [Staphylococcus aureus]HDB8504655.1 cystatin-like fold lipoprotein [Staphylococcus aureus]
MRRWFVLILGLVILLSACGQKYDKEIDEVTKLEKESIQDVKNTKKYKNVERSKSYYKIYNDGEVIIMTYMPFKDSNTKVSRVYKINQTSDKYEEDSNIDAEKFEKDNKPVYEENNMKNKESTPYTL